MLISALSHYIAAAKYVMVVKINTFLFRVLF